jgi:cobalt-zinc-cadmium efflux system membrane fusion protein
MTKYIYIALTAFLILACGHESHDHEEVRTDHSHNEGPKGDRELSGVEIAPITTGWFEKTILATGTIELPPAGRRKMTQIHGGYITSTALLPGQKVHKGQVLCKIQNPVFVDLQKDYLAAKAKATFLRKDLERKESLLEGQGVSTQDYERARAAYEENQVMLAGWKAQLQLIGIRAEDLTVDNIRSSIAMYAPFNGYVTNVHINPGQYVGPTDVLFELIDTDHLHAHLEVFEKDAALLKKGQAVRLYSSYQPDEICAGEIFLIDKSLSESSIMGVHVDLDEDHKDHLNVGMYIQGRIVVRWDSSWVVPLEALVRDGDGGEGLIVEKGEDNFEWMAVDVVDRNDDLAMIDPFWEGTPPRFVMKNAYKVYATLHEDEGMDMGHSH